MGAQLSKGGVDVDGKAVADPAAVKTNGQENGHVKTNGDVSAKPEGEAAAVDGNGTAEVAKEEPEAGAGDAIEPAPTADGDEGKTEGDGAAKETKKKKKFSLKNSFKFKGISLKKNKKGSEEGKEEDATSPAAEEKPEENGHAAKETKEEEPVAAGDVAAAPEAEKAEDPAPAPVAEETAATPTEEAAKPEESSPPDATPPADSEQKAE